ncbi:DUF362 domain-containing protein [Planctomycetota bacterium]
MKRIIIIKEWMRNHHLPPLLILIVLGILSTVWFLIRVIPKPSRATYPCMQIAAPFMSGLVVFLLSLGGGTLTLRKAARNFFHGRYFVAGSFLLISLFFFGFSVTQSTQNSNASTQAAKFGPDDGANQPIGEGLGINPGRVVWVWDPEATNENCLNTFESQDWFWKPENTNQDVVAEMVRNAVMKIASETTLTKSWDALFRYHNKRKSNTDKGYTKGEKIFIKINQNSARMILREEDFENGYHLPSTLESGEERRKSNFGATDAGPFIVLELLRELVNEAGVNQSDIAVGDPQNPLYGHNYDVWFNEFPDIKYIDRNSTMHGRTLISPTSEDLIFYSDKKQNDKLYDIIENADYFINVANLKPHNWAGISLNAKNLYGAQSRRSAGHLHYSLVVTFRDGIVVNGGYHKYRALVDLMGSKYFGRNTMLFIVDGLFAGGSDQSGVPVKYFMPPFNNDWCNSIFLSQDQVALESVCFDFLRTEWDGINEHDPRNSKWESMPNANGVDDYLHQAADSSNWPEGITYDPDNSGKPLPSLGVHEHWNDPVRQQYSRNLGKSKGIELISVPANIVGSKDAGRASKSQTAKEDIEVPGNPDMESLIPDPKTNKSKFKSVLTIPFRKGFTAKKFYSGIVDDRNSKWFLTDKGVVRVGLDASMMDSKIPTENLKSLAYQSSAKGSKAWIATDLGLIGANIPIGPNTYMEIYNSQNSSLLGDSVITVAAGINDLQWIGTDKGVSALSNNKWLIPSYESEYPVEYFTYFPITTMATDHEGDALYAATLGAGVARFHRNDVDGITGASPYAEWGPIKMPSDDIYSICITEEAQWFGTDLGIAKHVGHDTLKNWTVYNTENGLVDNFVQAIAVDSHGKIWVGTKGGISVCDDSDWTSYTTEDGLISNNILCIVCDKEGAVYLGTDLGYMIYNNGDLVCYH